MSDLKTTDDRTVVKPEGKVTAANANELRKELQSLVSDGHVHLVIDLSHVDMIDSRGLSVFIVCHQSVSEAGGSLSVIGANEDLRGLFRVMRLDEHFSVNG
ncbi:MAG: STAS domain-containing protein [Planctomycetota bacterium]|jgi:anti-sigma B factor antagonist